MALVQRIDLSWAGTASVQTAHSIKYYAEFEDEVPIVASDRGKGRGLIARTRSQCKSVLTLDLTYASVHSVDMLTSTVQCTGSSLRTFPKPRSMGPPLRSTSADPRGVHRSWPPAALRHQLLWCSDDAPRLICAETHTHPASTIAALRTTAVESMRGAMCR